MEGASESARMRTEGACASRSVQPGKAIQLLHFQKKKCEKIRTEIFKAETLILLDTMHSVSNQYIFHISKSLKFAVSQTIPKTVYCSLLS